MGGGIATDGILTTELTVIGGEALQTNLPEISRMAPHTEIALSDSGVGGGELGVWCIV